MIEKIYVNNRNLKVCIFMNELAKEILRQGGHILNYKDSLNEYAVYETPWCAMIEDRYRFNTKILNYLSFILDDVKYYLEFNNNMFMETRISKQPILRKTDTFVVTDNSYYGDTLQIEEIMSIHNFIHIEEKDLKDFAKEILEKLKERPYSKFAPNYQDIDVSNTYNCDTHKERVHVIRENKHYFVKDFI